MNPFLPFSLAGLLLVSGCPDTQVPKAPPKVPEPKASSAVPQAAPQAQLVASRFNGHSPA
ncbi:hypothetical protein [Polaromonas sp. YR568]|uniref:hypothetical protein n=1 Tax=Polaromonas sp. YR568 TaxID=1855301 RepID=UPI00398C1606